MLTKSVLLSSIIYFYAIFSNNAFLKYLFKPLTTLLIIGVAKQSSSAKSNNIKLAGLGFSLLGDICLMFSGESMFLLGLAAFLIAHLFYIRLFVQRRKRDKSSFVYVLSTVAVVYFSMLYGGIQQAGGLPMLLAVFAYTLVITVMVYYAILNDTASLTVGALLFFVSDATIGLERFMNHPKAKDHMLEYIIMSTYYLAQFCIAKY